MKYYAGLDVSMKETFICIQDETGKVISQTKAKTDPYEISESLKKHKVQLEKVGLESGALSHWLTEELRKHTIPVICIDARKMATLLSVRINKTDKNDAKGIAEAMRCGMYTEVAQKSKAAIEIATLMRSRRLLIQQKVQTTNAIRGFLKTYGIRLGSVGEMTFADKVRKILSESGCEIARVGIEALIESFEKLIELIRALTLQVEAIARKDEDVKLLMTIPGIGAVTALSFKVEIDDPKRFKDSRAVGAYLGMTPRQYSSGEIQQQGRISKCGSTEVRNLLCEAAIVMMTRTKSWSKLKAWGLRIAKKHGFKKAATAVGRKMAVMMHSMLITKKGFIHGEPEQEKTHKKEQLTTVAV